MSTATKTRPKTTPAAKAKAREASAAKVEDLVAETAAALVKMMTEGEPGTWLQPWTNTDGRNLLNPVNAVTGGRYTGFNPLRLALAATEAGYTSALWATYKQWESVGAQVRKGETGTQCVRWLTITKKEEVNAEGKAKSFVVPKTFALFAAEQVDNFEMPEPPVVDWEADDAADGFFAGVGADVRHGGNRAYYAPAQDYVAMPDRSSFAQGSDYYATLAHELCHWTGHESRNARAFGARFGSDAYAVEELVAELGSATLCAQLGLSLVPRPDHAQYLAHWVRVLNDDPKAIMRIAGDAGRAVDFLLAAEGAGDDCEDCEDC